MLTRDMIDKTVPIPIYFQLKELLLKEIKNGTYPSGSMIPTEQELSEIFDISRTTIRHAISELVQEGWLYRVKSKGTIVSKPKITQNFIQTVKSFNQEISSNGRVPSTKVLELKVIPASDEVAKALQLQPGEKVIFLDRLRFADDEPIVVATTYLSYERCKQVLDHDFVHESLYTILGVSDKTGIHMIRRIVEACSAISSDVKLLDIHQHQPVQQFTSIGYNMFQEPIEYTIARYRGDRNSFEVIVVPSDNRNPAK